jgi:predicted ester cyclase
MRQPPARQDPETTVRTYFRRLLVERDLSVCDDLLAEAYVDHDAPPGTPPGPQATRAYVAKMLHEYPDLRFAVDQLVTLGPVVALRASWSGTHRDAGPPLRRTGLVLVRVDDAGRIAERRSTYDRAYEAADTTEKSGIPLNRRHRTNG